MSNTLLSFIHPFINIIKYPSLSEYYNKIDSIPIPNKIRHRKTLLERIRKKNNIVLTQNISLIEIEKQVDSQYNIVGEYTFFYIEFIHIFKYIFFYIFDKEVPTLVSSYWNTNKEFLERFYIRLDCLHNGWKPIHIETLFKKYYDVPLDKDYIVCHVYDILKAIIQFREPVLPKGRPKLSNMCKQILKKYYYKNVNKKIKQNNHLKQQVSNLLTDTNIGYIVDSITKNNAIPEEEIKKVIEGIQGVKEILYST